MTEVSVVVCVDVDPDGTNSPYKKTTDELQWRGAEKEIPKIVKFINCIRDTQRRPAKFTWFLRCDEQINKLYDDRGWFLYTYNVMLEFLKNDGHELGWHPHFWRRKKGKWSQETDDAYWMTNCLDEGFEEFKRWSNTIPSVRMGWAFHNNYTMVQLSGFGVKADLSALPGLSSPGRMVGGQFADCYDWSTTPDTPYCPSAHDYRKDDGYNNMEILEIPMTVSHDPLLNALFGMAIDNKFKAFPPRHHLTPFKTPKKFRWILRNRIKAIKKKGEGYIGMYFHPTDMFNSDAFKTFKQNMRVIPTLMAKEKVDFSFCTAKELAQKILEGGID